MSAVKERIFGAVTIMNEHDAEQVWDLIQSTITPRTWDDIEEVEPTIEETTILDAYENGDTNLQPYYSQEEAMKQLGLV